MAELYPYQRYTVERFRDIRSVLIGDVVGLGKTAQALSLDLERRKLGESFAKGKTLIVTPLAVINSWTRQLDMWAPHLSYIKIHNRKRNDFIEEVELQTKDVYICHWDALRLIPELKEQQWFHVIADECLVGDTIINTPYGPKKIQNLDVNDEVYGFDHAKQQVVPTKVKHTFKRSTTEQLYVIENIRMTGNHPIWTEEWGYIDASQVDVTKHTGIRINIKDYTFYNEKIISAELEETSVTTDVYNIETETGNYFAKGLLVHNCHKIQNRDTKMAKALKAIPATFKTGLSGTPAYDKPDDLWSILNWLYPTFWTSYWNYFNRYVMWVDYNGYKQIIGVNNQEELQDQMRGFYIRRKKEEVLQDLPEKTYTEIIVDLDPKQRRAYNQMRDNMLSWVGENEDKPVPATQVVAQLTRLQQFASAHAEITEDGKMILSDPSSKVDAAIEILYGTNTQVVFFSQFTQVINLFCKRLEKNKITFGKFTGETSQKERAKTISGFVNGDLKVFAGNVGAGGTGIDGLQVASTVVFFDRPWSHSVFEQAVGRLDRIGQKNNIQIIDLIAAGTIERKRMEKIHLEWGWIQELLGEEA